MTTIFADIFSTVMENGRVDVNQERDFMLAELEAEIEFECHEREMSDEKTAAAIEYALTHIGLGDPG